MDKLCMLFIVEVGLGVGGVCSNGDISVSIVAKGDALI